MYENPHDTVGYGNPPRHTQFKKGKSGNPKGRPKGRMSFGALLEKVFNEKLPYVKNGRRMKATADEVGLMQLRKRVAEGDRKALLDLADLRRVFGKKDGEERNHVTFIIEDGNEKAEDKTDTKKDDDSDPGEDGMP